MSVSSAQLPTELAASASSSANQLGGGTTSRLITAEQALAGVVNGLPVWVRTSLLFTIW